MERRRLWTPFQIFLVVSLLSRFCRCGSKTGQPESRPVNLIQEGREWVEQALTGLALEEKVGQMLQDPYYADNPV